MRFLSVLLVSAGLALAAEDSVPEVEAVISERVRKLPVPAAAPVPKGITMAVTATDPKAQQHVLDGVANLHGGWDFEAYRHFCAALAIDPDCLMAHWGVVMSLISPEPDLLDERVAALRRMVALVEEEAGTELERSYAYAIAVFFDQGAAAAADAFRKVSEKFPNDPQLKLMAAAFGRTGYGDDGRATPDQEKAEALIDEMLIREPDHPIYLHAYLTIRAEAPDLRGDLARARRLCELAPSYAPFLHLLGHYELRTGHPAQAVEAFAQAGEAYAKWMKDTGLGHADCPGWVKAECYRAVALASKGDYSNALAVAKSVGAIKLPPERAASEGGQLLLWEGRTLSTRLLMRRSRPGDTALALAALPRPEDQKVFGTSTHAVWLYQGLAFVLESRKALEAGKPEEARKIADALTLHGEQMVKTREAAVAAGERSAWMRAFAALEVCASELRGAMAMAGPKKGLGAAYNWYRAALDRQAPASMLMPPAILLPMQARLAEFYLAKGDTKAAVDILIDAQTSHTNDIEVLSRLQTALAKAGHPGQSAAVGKEIEKLKTE
jgi:tetratricopeptide (TPR) repeat protein